MVNSVARGTSLDKLKLTDSDSGAAFVKKLRYRRANVSETGSWSSIRVCWSCARCQICEQRDQHITDGEVPSRQMHSVELLRFQFQYHHSLRI